MLPRSLRIAVRILLSICFLSLVSMVQAQNSDPNNDTGIHPYETYDGARENVNFGSGNVFISVPLLTLPGRNGHNYTVSLISNSQTWTTNAKQGGNWVNNSVGMVVTRTGAISFGPTTEVWEGDHHCTAGYILQDENGGVHAFEGLRTSCYYNAGSQRDPGADVLDGGDGRGDGFGADISANGCKVTMTNGNWVPLLSGDGGCPNVGVIGRGSYPPTLIDSNGNQITSGAGNGSSVLVRGGGDLFPVGTETDTLYRSIVFANNTIKYKDSNGVQRTITLNVQTLQLSCTFADTGGRPQPSGTPKVDHRCGFTKWPELHFPI